MSKAPEHFKPFDAAQARMGAPFGCKNGDKATVTIWTDARLTGYVEDSMGFHGIDWNANGDALRNEWFRGCDLVMLPLGMCEGKPVFVGDKLTDPTYKGEKGQDFVVETGIQYAFARCVWPRQVAKYPKTRMTNSDYAKVLNCGDKFNLLGCENIANAAIARAIQDGDVVPSEMLEKVAKEVQKAYTQSRPVGGGGGSISQSGGAKYPFNGGGTWIAAGGGSGGGGSGSGAGSIVPVFVVDIAAIIKRVKEGKDNG